MKQLAIKDRSDIEGNGHLARDPARKKNESMKKTNGCRQTDPHNRNVTGTSKEKCNRKEAYDIVNNHHLNMA